MKSVGAYVVLGVALALFLGVVSASEELRNVTVQEFIETSTKMDIIQKWCKNNTDLKVSCPRKHMTCWKGLVDISFNDAYLNAKNLPNDTSFEVDKAILKSLYDVVNCGNATSEGEFPLILLDDTFKDKVLAQYVSSPTIPPTTETPTPTTIATTEETTTVAATTVPSTPASTGPVSPGPGTRTDGSTDGNATVTTERESVANTNASDDGSPLAWTIPLIIVVLLIAVAAIAYFIVKKKKAGYTSSAMTKTNGNGESGKAAGEKTSV